MKTILIAGAALLMTATTTSALARDRVKPTADRNGDGQVSMQERQDERVSRLMRWDRDGDGRLSQVEYDALAARRAAKQGSDTAQANGRKGGKDLFARYDRDGDGFISGDEIRERIARKYARTSQAPRYDAPAAASAPAPGGGAR
jgi:hypothetical protein